MTEQEIAPVHRFGQACGRVVVVAAVVSALVASVVAQAGRTTASEPGIGESRLEAPAVDPACRELIAIPKRGWVCERRRPFHA
jgi:hypothetical protein